MEEYHFSELFQANTSKMNFQSEYQRSLTPSSSPTDPLSSASAILIDALKSSRISGAF